MTPLAAPDRKPFQVKLSSEVEASTTPPMMGTSVSATAALGLSPRNSADSRTARGGREPTGARVGLAGARPGARACRPGQAEGGAAATNRCPRPACHAASDPRRPPPVGPACCPSQIVLFPPAPPENIGSSALIVCVKETATEPRLMLVSALPSVCTAASGEMDTACRGSTGRRCERDPGRSRALHRRRRRRRRRRQAPSAPKPRSLTRDAGATPGRPHVLHKVALGALVQAQQPHGASDDRANGKLERGDGERVGEDLEHLLVVAAGEGGRGGREGGAKEGGWPAPTARAAPQVCAAAQAVGSAWRAAAQVDRGRTPCMREPASPHRCRLQGLSGWRNPQPARASSRSAGGSSSSARARPRLPSHVELDVEEVPEAKQQAQRQRARHAAALLLGRLRGRRHDCSRAEGRAAAGTSAAAGGGGRRRGQRAGALAGALASMGSWAPPAHLLAAGAPPERRSGAGCCGRAALRAHAAASHCYQGSCPGAPAAAAGRAEASAPPPPERIAPCRPATAARRPGRAPWCRC